jgi:bromodomain-containing protein 7/9
VRNATWRQKGKEREDEAEGTKVAELPPWRMPREAQATDFGSFAVLAGELAEEMRRRGMTPPDTEKETVDHEVNMQLIRERLDCDNAAKKLLPVENAGVTADLAHVNGADLIAKNYWSTQRAAEAEEYIRDLVYGGVEGLAYVRSLAEFVDGDCYHKEDEVRAPLCDTGTFVLTRYSGTLNATGGRV